MALEVGVEDDAIGAPKFSKDWRLRAQERKVLTSSRRSLASQSKTKVRGCLQKTRTYLTARPIGNLLSGWNVHTLQLLKQRAKLVASPDFRERMRRRAAENKEAEVNLLSVSRSQTQARSDQRKKQRDARLANSRARTFTAADLANKSAESTPQVT